MFEIEKNISSLISSQFPELYREEGENLVEFIKQYYEFLETSNNAIRMSRNLPDLRDIDTTLDEFIIYFKNKYMNGIPNKILGNKREIQKHILDLYRSKGSNEGLKLFFRLFFDEDIETYIPSYDILKASDGIWSKLRYLEVTEKDINSTFQDKLISGLESGATAIVESVQRRINNESIINVFFLTNVQGEFKRGEIIFYEGANLSLCPSIIGSVNFLEIVSGNQGLNLGDLLSVDENLNSGHKGLLATPSEVFDGGGIIEFTLINGGFGYTTNAVITISPFTNTTGTGAEFEIIEVIDTIDYVYNPTLIYPYLNVELDADNYAFGVEDTSNMATANINTIISNAVPSLTTQIGTISKIRTLNPGIDYDGDVLINIEEPIVSRARISDGKGGIWGNNAVVWGNVAVGTLVSDLRVLDSGFGYYDEDELLVLRSTTNSVNNNLTVKPILGAIGEDLGRWINSQGFLNSDKYLQDSDYYQEYSYEISSSRSLDKYINALRRIIHPSGNKPFSKAIAQRIINKQPESLELSILTKSSTDSLTYTLTLGEEGSLVIQDYIESDYFLTDYVADSSVSF